MTVSSANAVVATSNIAPTAKQIILLALILIPFRLATGTLLDRINRITGLNLNRSFGEAPKFTRGGACAPQNFSSSSLVTCHSSLSLKLAFVIRAVEVTFRFSDEAVID